MAGNEVKKPLRPDQVRDRDVIQRDAITATLLRGVEVEITELEDQRVVLELTEPSSSNNRGSAKFVFTFDNAQTLFGVCLDILGLMGDKVNLRFDSGLDVIKRMEIVVNAYRKSGPLLSVLCKEWDDMFMAIISTRANKEHAILVCDSETYAPEQRVCYSLITHTTIYELSVHTDDEGDFYGKKTKMIDVIRKTAGRFCLFINGKLLARC